MPFSASDICLASIQSTANKNEKFLKTNASVQITRLSEVKSLYLSLLSISDPCLEYANLWYLDGFQDI